MREYIVYESESVEVTDYLGGTHRVCHHEKREEIVRCRDCKHYGFYDGSWCRRTYEPVPSGIYDYQTVEPDGFCKWGERK